jgi:hypothetical protein
MNRGMVSFLGILSLVSAGCTVLAIDWPDRQDRTPEQMLTDLIVWQQRKYVRTSTGELAHECFTDVDFESFNAAGYPSKIVSRLKKAKDFEVIAAALRTLPGDQLAEVTKAAKQIARPTWRQMGFIDPEGRGQTEAGHEAELMIATAIADAFANEAGGR